MSARVSAKPTVYESHGFYYFKFQQGDERITVATRCTSRKRAEEFRDLYMSKSVPAVTSTPNNLGELLGMFRDVKTNPKLKDSAETGISYTERYARYEAVRARHVMEVTGPEILVKDLDKLTKGDLETIRRSIHNAYGNRPVAHDTFRTLKTILNYAFGKGWMKHEVGYHMPGIKATRPKRMMITPREDVLYIWSNPIHFRNETERDIFYILATTGLRRAELAAIQGRQVRRAVIKGREIDVLEVSQAFKDANYKTISTPKWDVERIIPVAPSTAKLLRKYKKGDDDFLFHMGNSQWTDMFDYIRGKVPERALEAPEALSDLTAHKLRHRLNTELLEADVKELLVQEYLSWHHQDRNKVQAGYTHLYLKSLIEVSDKIEELYGMESVEPCEEDDIQWLD